MKKPFENGEILFITDYDSGLPVLVYFCFYEKNGDVTVRGLDDDKPRSFHRSLLSRARDNQIQNFLVYFSHLEMLNKIATEKNIYKLEKERHDLCIYLEKMV